MAFSEFTCHFPDQVPAIVTAVLGLMKRECKDLRCRESVLKQTSASSLAEFEWDKVVEELENLTPTLLRFLKAACGMADSWKPKTIADLDKENRMAMAGSILLNVRYPSLNAPLYVNGMELYKAGLKRRTFSPLHRIGFCVGYGNVIAKLRESAEGRLFLRKGNTGHAPASVDESTMDAEEQVRTVSLNHWLSVTVERLVSVVDWNYRNVSKPYHCDKNGLMPT